MENVRGAITGVLAMAAGLLVLPVAAQFPTKTITYVGNYPPGPAQDIIARTVMTKVGERNGWATVAEYRPGANGLIGVQAVHRAPADGHTLLVAGSTVTILATTMKAQLGYDPSKDFVPMTRFIRYKPVLVAAPSLPANNFAELLAYTKANPGKLNYATSAAGGWNNLLGELLKRETGLSMTHIPFKSGGQVDLALMNGSVPLGITVYSAVLPSVKAGKMKLIAVVGGQRIPGAPDVAAVGETIGTFTNLDVDSWAGFFVRSGTPKDIVARLHQEIVAVLRLPEIQKLVSATGDAPAEDSLEAFGDKYREDILRWEKLVRDLDLKLE